MNDKAFGKISGEEELPRSKAPKESRFKMDGERLRKIEQERDQKKEKEQNAVKNNSKEHGILSRIFGNFQSPKESVVEVQLPFTNARRYRYFGIMIF